MSLEKTKLKIRPQDEVLFHYLFSVKVALIEHINRDVYLYQSVKSLYSRLNQFAKAGWIRADYHPSKRAKKVFSLSKKGFRRFIANSSSEKIQLGSGSLNHDLELVDIRCFLLNSPMIEKLWTENDLQCVFSPELYPMLIPFQKVNADGALSVSFPKGKVMLALEYESIQKQSGRYKSLLKKYYQSDEIDYVLYLCKNHSIERAVITQEDKLYKNYRPKFFYRVASDLWQDPSLSFFNRKQERLSLQNSNTKEFEMERNLLRNFNGMKPEFHRNVPERKV